MQSIMFAGAQDSLRLQLGQNQQVGAVIPPQNQQSQTAAMLNGSQINVAEATDKKVPFKHKFLNFVATVKKSWANLAEYGKGTIKGVLSSIGASVVTVGTLFTGHQIAKSIKNNKGNGFFKTFGGVFKNLWNGAKANLTKTGLKKTLKSARGIGTILAATSVFAGVMIKTLYDATLNANQRKHDIDEKYQKTPAVLKK